MFDIEVERDQLVATWTKAFAANWMTSPKASVLALLASDETKFAMAFRQAHNLFGWKAGDTLSKLGLCSGAIYRTEKFMSLAQDARCGSKGEGRSVHIEHTVPIAELTRQWVEYRRKHEPDLAQTYAWMLCNSVTTAFHIDEMGGIKGYERKTEAFNPESDWFNRPFVRYGMKEQVPAIWNVLSGERIDIETWTFADHFQQVERLFDVAGCDEAEANSVRQQAGKIIVRMAA
ncbi:hypothetical protein O9X98_05890 [Agrobacterium salinitolerans]|nr:hypothetical protein [Agrobacterium salinitolerans]